MAAASQNFEWPIGLEATHALVSDRAFRPFLDWKKAGNQVVWENPKSWWLGFYFGKGDTRLWVPRLRPRHGRSQERVINFCHPLGRKAFRVLALAYSTGAVALGMIVAWLFGLRW